MKYDCLGCPREIDFPDLEPQAWGRYQYGVEGHYHHLCDRCGSLMAPASFIEQGFSYQDARICFSRCKRAEICNGFDQYRPDCELPGLKAKCLEALHAVTEIQAAQIEDIHAALRSLGLKLPVCQGDAPFDTQLRESGYIRKP